MSLDDVFERNLNHKVHKAGWLRAAVLGANDGLVSIASLIIGIAAAGKNDFLFTGGCAGIAAGAMSMAVGEYISVRSQTDIELADRRIETEHLAIDPEGYRLGQGGGFYDRALVKDQVQSAWTIGLIHPDEISSEDLPRDEWDVALNAAATPDLVLRFS